MKSLLLKPLRMILGTLLFFLTTCHGQPKPPPPENGPFPDMDRPNHNKPPKKTMFGTSSGYDVGGTDPLCWSSFFSSSSSDSTTVATTSDNELDQLNAAFYQDDAAQVALLPVCPAGTIMTMTPLDDSVFTTEANATTRGEEVLPELLMDHVYTFRLVLEMNLSSLLSDQQVLQQHLLNDNMSKNVTIHCRLHLCNAMSQGFCNPLKDTRERDEAITKAESDLVEDDEDEVLPDANTQMEETMPQDKWKYAEGTALVGLTDIDDNDVNGSTDMDQGDSIYTRWIKWTMKEQDASSFVYRASVDMSVVLPQATTQRGAYFFLGHAMVDFGLPNGQVFRLDVAQTIPDKVVQVRPAPQILQVTKTTKWWLGSIIAVCGMYCLYCLQFIVRHQKHAVMKLAQGNFLAAMTAACFLQTVSSFLFLPTHDVFCHLKGPLVKVPLTFVGATLVGRVWRVYTTLNAAHSMGKHKSNVTAISRLEASFVRFLDILAGMGVCFGGQCCCRKKTSLASSSASRLRPSLRRSVTAGETTSLIMVLTLPQLVLQIYGSFFIMDDGLDIEYTQDGNVGRVVCTADHQWVDMTGTAFAAFVYALAVVMAWISRDLPSAFNEKDQIFHAASLGTILVVMSLALSQITDLPTTSPDVTVFLSACVSIGAAVFVLMLIIWPKIKRVRSGDKVVVSTLLGSRFGSSSVTSRTSMMLSVGGTMSDFSNSPPPEQATSQVQECGTTTLESEQGSQLRKRIVVRPGDPVPQSIESKVFEVQRLLREVTHQCGDGRPLTAEEWQNMQEEVDGLQAELHLVDLRATDEHIVS